MTRSDLPARDRHAGPDKIPEPRRIGLPDLSDALTLGWRDFRRAPAFGLIFSAFYVLGGWALASVALASGQDWWLIPFILGFPLIVYALIWAGLSVNVALAICFTALIALDWYFDWSAVMALMTPIILIGGMTMGWFTPTEAAVAAVMWSLFLGLVRYRSMTMRTLAKAAFDTIETTASVLFIVTAASIFAWLLTVGQAAQALSDLILGITDNKWVFLILVNLLVLFVGCFLDTIAAITILVPILLPIVLKFGIDPVHFGVIITLNLMIGLLHPPLGMVLFVLSRVAKLSVERTTMAILPWLVPLFVALILITFVPILTLWLPQTMGMIR